MTFYHGTSEEIGKEIQKEGILFGKRLLADKDGNIIKELDRCTYLAADANVAKKYGEVLLEVQYNPFDDDGNIRKDSKGEVNNYVLNCWQLRVYEPISIDNIKRIGG